MSPTQINIYQAIAKRGEQNEDYFEKIGPIKCTNSKAWLGDGYYFWDTRIDDAHWWGRMSRGDYFILRATMQLHPGVCFDLEGCVAHREIFDSIGKELVQQLGQSANGIYVKDVLTLIRKKLRSFDATYGAIRACGVPLKGQPKAQTYRFDDIHFFHMREKVQICITDKTKVSFANVFVAHIVNE